MNEHQVNDQIRNDTWAERGTSGWVTIVEIEFQHVMHAPGRPDDLGPRPDRLHPGLNTAVTAISENGLLAWLHDGSVVHVDWSIQRQSFARRDGKGELMLSDIRAWAALPSPIAQS